jgi:hypothetical protein
VQFPGGGGFGEAFKHRLTYLYGLFDLIASVILVALIWGSGWLVYIAAFAAVAPDLANIYRYYRLESKGLAKPGEGNVLVQFHHNIQWGHYQWGLIVEIVTAIFLLTAIIKIK